MLRSRTILLQQCQRSRQRISIAAPTRQLDLVLSGNKDEDADSSYQRTSARNRGMIATSFGMHHPLHLSSYTAGISSSSRCHKIQSRSISSISSFMPEIMQGFSIWGGTAVLLNTFHGAGVPYWACFSLINLVVRISLFPLVIYSAHAASRFGKVAVELQFFVSMFQNDWKNLKKQGATTAEMVSFFRMGLESIRGIYKIHNINPLAAFLSPLMQLPFFIYVSIDLRKIVNGRDPELAQELTATDNSLLFWISDLTEPDPFYALPIIAGVAMYANVETALGRKTLAGENTSKATTGILLKDLFQSFSVFMPCFASHNPAGIQVYLCTSFMYTMVQGFALRNEQFRLAVGLPSLHGPPQTPELAGKFVDLKKLERKADELRGDGPVLGTGVLAHNWRLSFPGTERQSSIVVSPSEKSYTVTAANTDDSHLHIIQFFNLGGNSENSFDPNVPFVPGISAPFEEMMERKQQETYEKMMQEQIATRAFDDASNMQGMSEEEKILAMEKANRGEKFMPTQFVSSSSDSLQNKPKKISPKQLRGIKKKGLRKSKSKRK